MRLAKAMKTLAVGDDVVVTDAPDATVWTIEETAFGHHVVKLREKGTTFKPHWQDISLILKKV